MGNHQSLDTEPLSKTTIPLAEYRSLIAQTAMGDTPTLKWGTSGKEFRATGSSSNQATNETRLLGIFTTRTTLPPGDDAPFTTARITHQPAKLVSTGTHRGGKVRLEVHPIPGQPGTQRTTPIFGYTSNEAA